MSVINRDDEEKQAQLWSQAQQIPYVDGRLAADIDSVTAIMTINDILDYRITPLSLINGRLDFGISPDADLGRAQFIRQKFPNYQVIFNGVSKTSFDEILKKLDALQLRQVMGGTLEEFINYVKNAKSSDAFRFIVERAYLMRASDIHIEPKAQEVLVRYRIDGALHNIMNLPLASYKIFLSAIQTQSKMTWGSDKPQGGRMDQVLVDPNGNQVTLNLRIESIPTLHGEEIIARLLTMDPTYLSLDSMDFSSTQRQSLDYVLSHPQGMVLAVGPTNSGKTSLLYAIINKINQPEVKVVTLEDPIEYELPGTSQIPVNSQDKELFAEKLRAVLREDPNIIMIGEIRDVDTAKTALQAALTGHLVLSTFHANTTAAAISRLMDLIGQNSLLPSAVRMIIAKRLVRRVCTYCHEQYETDKATSEQINAVLQGLPKNIYQPQAKFVLTRGKGCNYCNGFGFLGRISISEVMYISQQMQDLIASGVTKATNHAVEDLAKREGMVTLLQDGVLKALAGLTTLDEVYKVVES